MLYPKYPASIDPGELFTVHQILKPWSETTVTWDSHSGNETYSMTSMCESVYYDADEQAYILTLNNEIIFSWVENVNTNFGLLIKSNWEMLQSYRYYVSSNSSSSQKRPKLKIYYTENE